MTTDDLLVLSWSILQPFSNAIFVLMCSSWGLSALSVCNHRCPARPTVCKRHYRWLLAQHSPQAECAEQGLCNCRVCVCYSVHLTAVAAGLLLSAMWTADRLSIDSGGRPWARALSSKCGPRQCHKDSRVDEDECRFRRVKNLTLTLVCRTLPFYYILPEFTTMIRTSLLETRAVT